MKSLVQILTEKYTPKLGKVGDLNKVKIIRHYTTAEGLAGMLDKGVMTPSKSQGDSDWRRFFMYGDAVVSFHDARYDPEWDEINEANRAGSTMTRTKTLGIHIDEICACIEYDFTALPKDIQEHCGVIEILETYVEDFYNVWTECCKIAQDIETEEDVLKEIPEDLLDEYNKSPNKSKWLKEAYDFFNRLRYIDFDMSDASDLLDFAIHRQTQKLMNRLLQIGWKKGDENNPIYLYYTQLYQQEGGEPSGRTIRADFLGYIAKHIIKSINDKINIEIRFDVEIPLKYAKRIIIFDGIVDYILSWGLSGDEERIEDMNNSIKDCESKYNIERIPVDKVAKKLR